MEIGLVYDMPCQCLALEGSQYVSPNAQTCYGVFLPIIIYMLNALNHKVCDNLYTDQGLDRAFFTNIGVLDQAMSSSGAGGFRESQMSTC